MIGHLRIGDTDAAERLIKEFHYSHRMPANIQCCATWHNDGGLFGDYGPAFAACLFSIPPTRWSEDVWELSRLVRRDDATCSLTGLISKTVAFMRRAEMTDLVVSFADSTQGHHGGIYQAASWEYDGKRGRMMDGILLNGVFVPGRSCNSKWGTRSPEKLRQIMPNADVQPHYDEGKHLYWKSLSRKGSAKASRLGLKSEAYPKPDRVAA